MRCKWLDFICLHVLKRLRPSQSTRLTLVAFIRHPYQHFIFVLPTEIAQFRTREMRRRRHDL